MYNFIKALNENRVGKELKQVDLKYPANGLGRSLSKQTITYHYGKLYKAYVDRYNAGEGDPDFNEAGAFLHSIYFSQFTKPKNSNKPAGAVAAFIEKHHSSWDKFQAAFEKIAMAVQGSGWVYLAQDGKIKTITNHAIKNDIVLLIDWWEHSFQFDYGSDKAKYLNNQWKIIDWDYVNTRL